MVTNTFGKRDHATLILFIVLIDLYISRAFKFYRFKFSLKTDDDCYLNMPGILQVCKQANYLHVQKTQKKYSRNRINMKFHALHIAPTHDVAFLYLFRDYISAGFVLIHPSSVFLSLIFVGGTNLTVKNWCLVERSASNIGTRYSRDGQVVRPLNTCSEGFGFQPQSSLLQKCEETNYRQKGKESRG